MEVFEGRLLFCGFVSLVPIRARFCLLACLLLIESICTLCCCCSHVAHTFCAIALCRLLVLAQWAGNRVIWGNRVCVSATVVIYRAILLSLLCALRPYLPSIHSCHFACAYCIYVLLSPYYCVSLVCSKGCNNVDIRGTKLTCTPNLAHIFSKRFSCLFWACGAIRRI